MKLTAEMIDTITEISSYFANMYAMHGGYCDEQDLMNEGIVMGLQKAPEYSPDRGAKFETFIYTHIRGAITRITRRKAAPVKFPVGCRFGGTDMSQWEPADTRTPTPESAHDLSDIRSEVNSVLDRYKVSSLKRSMLWDYASGKKQAEIAAVCGKSTQRVSQIINDLLDKLRCSKMLASFHDSIGALKKVKYDATDKNRLQFG